MMEQSLSAQQQVVPERMNTASMAEQTGSQLAASLALPTQPITYKSAMQINLLVRTH